MTPQVIHLAPDARERLVRFLMQLEPRMGPGGDLEHIGEWAGKLGGLVLRYAALFHVWEHAAPAKPKPWEVQLPKATLERAIRLAEAFLIPHALTVFGEMGADPALEQARIVLDTVARWEAPTFTRRDLHQRLRRRFPRPRELDGPLALLVEHSYIRPEVVTKQGPGRKPSDRYEINPRWERPQNPHNTQKSPLATEAVTPVGDSEDNVNSVYASDEETGLSGSAYGNGEWREEL